MGNGAFDYKKFSNSIHVIKTPFPHFKLFKFEYPLLLIIYPSPFFEMEANKTAIFLKLTQPEFTCSKLAIEAPKQGMKYVES